MKPVTDQDTRFARHVRGRLACQGGTWWSFAVRALVMLVAWMQAASTASVAFAQPPDDVAEAADAADENPKLESGPADEDDEAPADDDKPASGLLRRLLLRALGISPDRSAEEGAQFAAILGKPAPPFELASLGGEPIKLADLQGKVVVLDFWASWCGPCRAAMPKLEKVSQAFKDDPVMIIGVNLGDDPEAAKEVVDKLAVTFAIVLDQEQSLSTPYLVSAIPQTVILDAKGVVQAVHQGNSPDLEEKLSQQIRMLLDGKNLFDADQLAQQQSENERRAQERVAALKLANVDRLVQDRHLIEDVDANLPRKGGPSLKLVLPGDDAESFAMVTPSLTLRIARPHAADTKAVSLPMDEAFEVLRLEAVEAQDHFQWLILGAYTDSETYDTTRMELHAVSRDGQAAWKYTIDRIQEESGLDADILVADITGDQNPEVLILEFHPAMAEDDAAAGFTARILTILDLQGQVLVRATVPGYGDCGMERFQQNGRTYLLLTTTEGITRFLVQ